jgi:hypothetical protein
VQIVRLVSRIRFSVVYYMFGHLHVMHNMYEIPGRNYHVKYYKKK